MLYDYRARGYDPWHGRFCQRDPALYAESLNLYQYALSNPLALSDPGGRWSLGGLLGSAATTAWMAYNVADTALGIRDFVEALADLVSARSLTYDAYLAVGMEAAFLLGDKLLGPVDEVVGLARGLRAVGAAKAGKNIAEWTTKELGDAIKDAGSIEDFLKAIDKADFDLLWSNKALRDKFEKEVRGAYGWHHWIQVYMLPQLMARSDKAFWIDAMRNVRRKIEGEFADVHRLTSFHNHLRRAYREGMSLDEYLAAIAEVARHWGVNLH